MSDILQWFPYPAYRPFQEEMLSVAGRVAEEGGTLLIDAPTGSGKSSVVSALLANRNHRLIIIAVRTVSQLATFVRELSLIREKQPGLSFSYLIGKGSMCPLGGVGDVYRKCEAVKTFSSSLMKDRALSGHFDPSKDPMIKRQIQQNDPEHPVICPFFIRSKVFYPSEKGGGLRIGPSPLLKNRADTILTHAIPPHELEDTCKGLCPYEVMMQASQKADVIICNYYHLFDDQIREALYSSVQYEPDQILLLIDEAHNCGESMQNIKSVDLSEKTLEGAERDIATLRKRHHNLDAIRHLIPQIKTFMNGLKRSTETEDWFDPGIFLRMILRESFYETIEEVIDDLIEVSETLADQNIKAGEFRLTGLERLTTFFSAFPTAMKSPEYLPVYRKDADGIILEIRNIDPSLALTNLVVQHHSAVLISGTLSPVTSYQHLFFRAADPNYPVSTLTLPNTFPRENRLLLGASDITTAFSKRQEKENSERIRQYIIDFSRIAGNLAVYFPSYQILETYVRLAGPDIERELLVEPKDPALARETLQRFISLPKKGYYGILFAVCGGKFSEGLDYRGEMLAGVMVIGLPLAPYNRVRQMIIGYYRQKFQEEGEFLSYTLPALNKALQSLGRVIRTPTDKGVLIFGDSRYLTDGMRHRLPLWMQEELLITTDKSFPEQVQDWSA
ncbi:MAG: ATP-dependent DNA helicase [Methanospirillaceae archaeon]|nr:ATP-dependent DNA helicase [Methanospirillaceae archaeon]